MQLPPFSSAILSFSTNLAKKLAFVDVPTIPLRLNSFPRNSSQHAQTPSQLSVDKKI